jgi:hypothetical protein
VNNLATTLVADSRSMAVIAVHTNHISEIGISYVWSTDTSERITGKPETRGDRSADAHPD